MEGELIQSSRRTLQEAHEDAYKKTMEEISNKSITYKVKYTKLVLVEEELTKQQIKELVDNPCVKSITINKND